MRKSVLKLDKTCAKMTAFYLSASFRCWPVLVIGCLNLAIFQSLASNGELTRDVITASDFFTNCGKEENCTAMAAGTTSGDRIPEMNYRNFPNLCRCDGEQCQIYGDCCPAVAMGTKLKLRNVTVGCYNLPEQQAHVLMIGSCPSEATEADDELNDMCTASAKPFSYLMDLPMYSERSNLMYRNVYCAMCNKESLPDLRIWTPSLKCSQNLTEDQRRDFLLSAQQLPGRIFQDSSNVTCRLQILEFLPREDAMAPANSSNIPHFRYCLPQITETCPAEAKNTRDALLCASYRQNVETGAKTYFKNIHCALCNGEGTDFETLRNQTKCYKYPNRFNIFRIKPSGIQLLFDFSFESTSSSSIGFQSRCGSGESWDYLQQRCQSLICKSGYSVEEGRCVHNKAKFKSEIITFSENCTRVLVSEDKFRNVSDTNSSIIVQTNAGGSNTTYVFGPEDYEYVNGSTVSVCLPANASLNHVAKHAGYVQIVSDLCIGISIMFAFAHLVLFALLRKLRNLPGKILASLTWCIFASQLVFLTLLNQTKPAGFCLAVAMFLHYFFLASFFWMSVMSFDIWRKFTGTMVSSRHQSKEGKKKSFIKYSLIAWGLPLLIVGAAAWVDLFPTSVSYIGKGADPNTKWNVLDHSKASGFFLFLEKIQPSFGVKLCWFNNRVALLAFFAAPVAVLVACNIILYALTARSILLQNKKSQKVLNKNSGSTTPINGKNGSDEIAAERHRNSVNARLYAKLALIMGLTWVLGFVANFTQADFVWLLFVILNGLQGTFIFFAFDWKKKVWQLFKRRVAKSSFGKLCPQFGLEESTSRSLSSRDRTVSTRTSRASTGNSRLSAQLSSGFSPSPNTKAN